MAQQRLTSSITGSSSTSQGPDVSTVEKEVNMLEMKGDSGHFSMIRQLHLADLITEMNGFCGAMSVFSSMRYCLDGNHSTLWLAMYFMPFGLFFDFMDGKVARWRKKSSLLGQELDSLADLISFGVAPAACAFACGFRTFIDTLILTVFILCGLSRLARFNVTVQYLPKDKTGKSKYFEGTPIPTTLSIVGILAFWLKKGWVLDGLPWGLIAEDTILEFHPAILLFFVHACAMVSKTLKIPKP